MNVFISIVFFHSSFTCFNISIQFLEITQISLFFSQCSFSISTTSQIQKSESVVKSISLKKHSSKDIFLSL